MSSQRTQTTPSLYWFVDDDSRPLALNLPGAKVFCFFGSRLNAETFKRVLDRPSDWILVGNKSASYLIELCERASQEEGYTGFALDPPPNYGGWFPTWTLDEFKGVIERTAAGEQGR
ncbi:MAG TPA: hypothetical protein VHF46_00875 [Rubrobacteraceae bacterium]|jgi:hypothetical protein|nr:hypothetical protein [Rubrobacteraceae bacterium]